MPWQSVLSICNTEQKLWFLLFCTLITLMPAGIEKASLFSRLKGKRKREKKRAWHVCQGLIGSRSLIHCVRREKKLFPRDVRKWNRKPQLRYCMPTPYHELQWRWQCNSTLCQKCNFCPKCKFWHILFCQKNAHVEKWRNSFFSKICSHCCDFYKKFSSNLIFGQKCGLLEQCEQEQE